MNSVRVFKFIMAVALLGMAGCASFSRGPGQLVDPAKFADNLYFSISSDGTLTPFTKDGKPFIPCSNQGPKKCNIYQKKINLKAINTIVIDEFLFGFNPDGCRMIKIIVNNKIKEFEDPSDPRCNE